MRENPETQLLFPKYALNEKRMPLDSVRFKVGSIKRINNKKIRITIWSVHF